MIFLQTFEFERLIDHPNLQADALLKAFAKTKARNRADVVHLIDTLKFMGQLGILFRGHRVSCRLEPVSDIKDIDTSAEKFSSHITASFYK